MKRMLSIALMCMMVFLLLPTHAMALGGIVHVTLKSGLENTADIDLDVIGNMVSSEEASVNGTFFRVLDGGVLYTRYKVSDAPESFGRTDFLCWKLTLPEQGYTRIARPGEVISDTGEGGWFILEAIWDGLEPNSYAFSAPQAVAVTENAVTTSIPFTLSALTLGSASQVTVWLRPGEFSDGENTIPYEAGFSATFTEAGQTENCSIKISQEEWAKAKAGRYTATLEYDVNFEYRYYQSIRTMHGSVPMTLQVGHDVTVSSNHPEWGTASASTAMAREGEMVTLTAAPNNSDYGFRGWRLGSGGVNLNADNTFIMGSQDVSVMACFDPLHDARFLNYNNALLAVVRVFTGETPEYAGLTPARHSSDRYDYFFSGWDPAPGPFPANTASVEYTAQFREEYKHLVTFDANGGTGTMGNGTFYASGGIYTLPPCGFTAPEGHVFRDWTVSWKNNLGGTSTFTYMAGSNLTGLTGDLTVTANWIELSLRASPAAAGTAEYASGIFTATANEGYTFDHWEYANDEFSPPAPVGTVWPTANPWKPPEVDYKIYTAVFTANQYALAIPDNIRKGTVIKYSGTSKTGNTIKLTVTPDEGCFLDSLSYTPEGGEPVSITETDKNGRYFFTMPPANVTISAIFKQDAYAITTDDAAQVYYYNDSYEQVFPTEAAEGTTLSLTLDDSAVPETGYYFTGEFTLNGVSLGRETSEDGLTSWPVTGFTMPDEDVTIGAAQAARETLALFFAPGDTRALPMDAWMQLQYYETAVGEPPLLRYDAATGTEALDVSRDGKPDLQIAFDDAANCVNLIRMPASVAVGEFAFAFSGPTDRYSTIVFNLITAAAPTFGTPDFTLPAALTTVEEEAFEGIAASVVDVSESCAFIGNYAFRNCPNLTQIRIPEHCALGTDVFDGCGTVYVFGAAESSAEAYCQTHDNCVFVPTE